MKSRSIKLFLIALTLFLLQLPIHAPATSYSDSDAVSWDIKTTKPKRPGSDDGQPDNSRNVNWNG